MLKPRKDTEIFNFWQPLILFIDFLTMFVIAAREAGFVFTFPLLWDKFQLTTVDKCCNPRATQD